MLVGLKRHAKNFKCASEFNGNLRVDETGRLIDPEVTPQGFFDCAGVIENARRSSMIDIRRAFVFSSKLGRAKITSFTIAAALRHTPPKAKVHERELPALDAEKPEDYLEVMSLLFQVADFCALNKIPELQAIILITHANNITKHIIERMIDRNHGEYTSEQADFLDDVIQSIFHKTRDTFDALMQSNAFQKIKAELTAEGRHKPEYSEMCIFDTGTAPGAFRINQGRHIETIKPSTLYL